MKREKQRFLCWHLESNYTWKAIRSSEEHFRKKCLERSIYYVFPEIPRFKLWIVTQTFNYIWFSEPWLMKVLSTKIRFEKTSVDRQTSYTYHIVSLWCNFLDSLNLVMILSNSDSKSNYQFTLYHYDGLIWWHLQYDG